MAGPPSLFAPRDSPSEPSTNSVLFNIISGIFADNNQIKQQYLSIIGLLYQAGINIALSAGAFLVFVALRPKNARVYARRYKAMIKDERRPPKIGKGILDWIAPLWRTDERFLLDTVGIDSVFFLRFLRLVCWLTAIFGVLGMCIIVPVNFSFGNNAYVTGALDKFHLEYITLYHITNLHVLWMFPVFAYLYTAIFFYFVWRELKYFIRVKQAYFASTTYQRKLQSRSFMVTRVPANMQSDHALHSFMASRCLNEAQPTQASIVRKLGELQELIDDHEKLVGKLEKVLLKYLAGNFKTKQRPRIKIKGAMIDAIEHYTRAIEGLENRINRTRAETETFNPTSVGFVSYSSPMEAHQVKRALKHTKPANVVMAPHPKDIIWSNAQMPKSKRVVRQWTARIISIVFCFVAFWPVAGLTFIGDALNIQIIWPDTVGFFNRHTTLTTIWQTTFTPLILTLYYIAIPLVFRVISRYQGISTNTGVERSVFKKMYVFYFLSNMVVLTLVGIVVRAVLRHNTFSSITANLPHDLIQSLNQKAQFWTAYVSLRGVSVMLELAQMISLTYIFFKRYTKDLTPRELRELTKPPEFDYSPVYSLFMWVFTISMFYSVYSPIILVFAFLDFAVAYWVYKYAVMYVYQTRYETGGAMWQNVVNRMIASMVIFQLYLIGCLKARIDEFTDRPKQVISSQAIVYFLVPLPVITAVLGLYLSYFWARPRANYIAPNSGALATDNSHVFDTMKGNSEEEEESLGDRFLHPIMSQPLATPMVDKRVRHLLPQVYRGRISTIKANPRSFSQKPEYAMSTRAPPSIANTSTVFGSEMNDLESVMDERDRHDFDGATTPFGYRPQQQQQVPAVPQLGTWASSSQTNYTTMDSRDMMEMQTLGRNGSQANLLGHAQPMSVSRAEVSDVSLNEYPYRTVTPQLSFQDDEMTRYGGNRLQQQQQYSENVYYSSHDQYSSNIPPRNAPRWD